MLTDFLGILYIVRSIESRSVIPCPTEELHDSQNCETLKYGHEARKQEWLCWRRPTAIYATDHT
jgi:hypothetical protein